VAWAALVPWSKRKLRISDLLGDESEEEERMTPEQSNDWIATNFRLAEDS